MRGKDRHTAGRPAKGTGDARLGDPAAVGGASPDSSAAGSAASRRGEWSTIHAIWLLGIAACISMWIGCGSAQEDVAHRVDPRGANLLGEAQQAYIGGNLGRAAALIDSAEIYIPDAADLWFLRGRVLADLYRFPASDSAFRKVLEIDPEYRNAHFAMGHNAFLQSTYYAKDAYRAALRYYTEEAELLRSLARSDLGDEAQRADGAPAAAERMDGDRPSGAAGSGRRTVQAQHGKDRKALSTVLLQIGTTYHRLNRPDSAHLFYRRAVEIDTTLARGYAWIGGIEQSLGRFDDALANARRAALLEPENPEYALLIGVILNDLGRYEEAVPHLTRAARELPTNRTAVHSLGTALVATGAPKEGAVYLARGDSMELLRAQIDQAHMGIFHDPQDPIRWENYAFLLHQAGQVTEARRAIQVMRQVAAAFPTPTAPEPAAGGSTRSPEETASQ